MDNFFSILSYPPSTCAFGAGGFSLIPASQFSASMTSSNHARDRAVPTDFPIGMINFRSPFITTPHNKCLVNNEDGKVCGVEAHPMSHASGIDEVICSSK